MVTYSLPLEGVSIMEIASKSLSFGDKTCFSLCLLITLISILTLNPVAVLFALLKLVIVFWGELTWVKNACGPVLVWFILELFILVALFFGEFMAVLGLMGPLSGSGKFWAPASLSSSNDKKEGLEIYHKRIFHSIWTF